MACRSGFAAFFSHSSLVNQMKLFTYLQHHDVHLSQKQYAVSYSAYARGLPALYLLMP